MFSGCSSPLFQSHCRKEPQRSRSWSWHASLPQDFLTEMRIVWMRDLRDFRGQDRLHLHLLHPVPMQEAGTSAEEKAIPLSITHGQIRR